MRIETSELRNQHNSHFNLGKLQMRSDPILIGESNIDLDTSLKETEPLQIIQSEEVSPHKIDREMPHQKFSLSMQRL
jgi:hypothetical protein